MNRALLGLAAVVLVATAAFLVLRRTESVPIPAPPPPDGVAPPGPPSLRGRLDWLQRLDEVARRPAPPSAPAASPAAEAVASATVHGRVSLRQTILSPGYAPRGYVYAVTATGDRRLLARTNVSDDLSYTLAIPLVRSAPTEVVVGVRIDGFEGQSGLVTVAPAQDLSVDFSLGRGQSIRGRVLARDGAPVGALEIYTFTSPYIGSSSITDKYFEDAQASAYSRPTERFYDARTKTDTSGRFELSGLANEKYTIWTPSSEWFIEQKRQVTPGNDEVELTAVRAVDVTLLVTDASSGHPVPAFNGEMVVLWGRDDKILMPILGRNGREHVVWSEFGTETSEGFSVEIRLAAAGYRAYSTTVRFSPHPDARREIKIPLSLADRGTARILAVNQRGDPVTFPLLMDLVFSTDPSLTRKGATSTEPAPGTHLFELESGRWFARVYPNHEFGQAVSWSGELVVPTSSEVFTRISLPDYGVLRLRRGSSLGSHTLTILLRNHDGSTQGTISVDGPERSIESFPSGRWFASVLGEERPGSTVTFDINVGETTDVLLEK